MDKYPVFCAYYIDVGVGIYSDLAQKLTDRCNGLGIPCDISSPMSLREFMAKKRKSVSTRNWICRYKPTFIKEMFQKHGRHIIYMDVDGFIRAKPPKKLFDMPHIGIDKQYGNKGGVAIFNTSVAAIYFNNTELVNTFLDIWHNDCMKTSMNKADHLMFKRTIVRMKNNHPDIVSYFKQPFVSLIDTTDSYIRHYKPSQHFKCQNNYTS